MSDLTGRSQNDTYKDLLHIENTNLGFDGTLRQIESGNGVGSSLSLSSVGASIAGTIAVSGVASFNVTPNVAGNEVWHAGNDGAGSGLDADTLRGSVPGEFLNPASNTNIIGDWVWNTSLLFSRANALELARFNDLTNNIQMLALFDANLDFSLIPGTAGVFAPASSFFYDSSLNRWGSNTDLAINKVNGKIYINTAGGQLPVMSVEPTLGDGVLLGDAGFNTFMTSDDGLFHLLGNTSTEFHAGIVMQDGATINGRVGFFDDIADQLIIESTIAGGAGVYVTTDGAEIRLETLAGDIVLDATGIVDVFGTGGITISSTLDVVLSSDGEIQLDNINGLAFITDDHTALTATSSAVIKDGSGVARYVGFNGIPSVNFTAATDLLSANVGYKVNFTGGSSVALTISGDANIPIGAAWMIANVGTSVFTLDDTGITLNWLDGGGLAAPTGARTLDISGVATLTKRAAGIYDIWGTGLY